jgi:hypothetical protein
VHNLRSKLLGQFALAANRVENARTPRFKLPQISETLLELAELGVIKAAGGLLTVARNEGNRGAFIEEVDCDFHLFGPRPDFIGEGSKNAVGTSGHSCYILLDSEPRWLCQVRGFYLSIGAGRSLACAGRLRNRVARRGSLEATISYYLVERIKAQPNIEMLTRSEVTALEGCDGNLETARWRHCGRPKAAAFSTSRLPNMTRLAPARLATAVCYL